MNLYCQRNKLILRSTLFLSSVLFKGIGKRNWRKILKFYSLCKGSDVKVATQKLSPERRAGLFIKSRHDTISPQSRFTEIKIWKTIISKKRNCHISEPEKMKKMSSSGPTQVNKLTTGVDGASPAWDILIGRLDFRTQMKISQQNQHLAEVVRINAESEIRKFKRHIREDKYM